MTEQPHPPNTDDIGARARTAAGWQFLSKGINTALQMVTSIVLARLLMPADFGIVAMAAMVTGLAGVFQDLGFGQALVQRREISEEHTRSAFWGTLVMALLLYAGVYYSAPYVGAYFDEPRMIPVLQISALSFVLSPFAVVPRSLLQRDLDFRTPFFAGLASSVAYGAVGITMALLGYGYWALVFAGLAGGAVSTVALCILTRYLPPIVPTFRGIGDLYGFGTGVTAVGISYYVASKIDYFAIGRRVDAEALGLYTRAYSFVTYPGALAATIAPIFLPAFSRMQDDHARMRSAYGRVTTLMATVFLPVLAVGIVAAPELVPTVFGEQWQLSIIPAQILAVAGAARVVSDPAGGVVKAAGNVYGEAWRQGVYGVAVGVGAWSAAPHGIVAVAGAVACANVLFCGMIGHLVWKSIDFGLSEYLATFRSPLLVSFATSAAAAAARYAAQTGQCDNHWVLIVTVAVGMSTAIIAISQIPLPECRQARDEVVALWTRAMKAVACIGNKGKGCAE